MQSTVPISDNFYIWDLMKSDIVVHTISRASYDWTFSYKLSRPVYCKQLVADNTIKFEKDSNNNLTGFKIEVENKTDSDATKINEMKAKKLEKILTILSGMELKALPAGAEGVPKKPGLRRVSNAVIVSTILKDRLIRSILQTPTYQT